MLLATYGTLEELLVNWACLPDRIRIEDPPNMERGWNEDRLQASGNTFVPYATYDEVILEPVRYFRRIRNICPARWRPQGRPPCFQDTLEVVDATGRPIHIVYMT